MIKNQVKKLGLLIWNGWKKFAFALGYINSRIILTLIYFIVFGVYAILSLPFRLFKKNKKQDTFWRDKDYREPTLENLEKQF
ncbi:MAG TPA: hypothetical protein VJB92_04070 [Candidatus Paceibacterota bacterium]